MKKLSAAFILTLLVLTLFAPFFVNPASAGDGNVIISSGGVSPDTGIFIKDGNTYTLTSDFEGAITVDGNDIIVNGAGHTVEGTGSGNGVSISSKTGVTIANLTVTSYSNGVYLSSSSNCKIIGNTITHAGMAIRTEGSTYANITSNAISDCTSGMYIDGDGNDNFDSITYNNVSCGNYGIEVFTSRNTVAYNVIRDTSSSALYIFPGIYSTANSNVLHDNIVICRAGRSIDFARQQNGQVYYNDFISSGGYNAGGDTNSWDNGTFGNYWSTIDHTDNNHDGFVDTPLTIGSGTDNYPLAEPFGLNLLNVTVVGSGTTNLDNGLNYELTGDHVLVTQSAVADGEFYNWILDGQTVTSDTITVTMDEEHNLTAVFKQVYYTLTVEQALDGAVYVNGDNSHTINGTEIVQGIDTTLSVQAQPVAGCQFYGWRLDGEQSTDNPKTVTFNENHTLQAIFITPPFYVLPGSDSDWSMIMHDSSLTGQTNSAGPANDQELWRFETEGAIEASPAVVDSVVYFGSDDDYVYAVNATTAQQIWAYQIGEAVTTSPAVANGIVFVSLDHTLYALNATTTDPDGELLWSLPLGIGGSNAFSPVVSGDAVYVTVGFGIYAFSSTDPNGHQLWAYTELDSAVSSSPAVANGKVYFNAENKVYVMNAATEASHEPLWRYDVTATTTSSIAVANGMVYTSDNGGDIYAFNATVYHNTPLWLYEGELPPKFSVVNGVVYAGTSGSMPMEAGYVFALNATTNNPAGQELWAYRSVLGGASCAPIVADGFVYAGVGFDFVTVFNATTTDINGERMWASGNIFAIMSSSAIADGVLFAGANDGKLYALAANQKVVFTQQGLPEGTSWTATLDGVTQTSTFHTITFAIAQDRPLSYTITAPTGYTSTSDLTGTLPPSRFDTFTEVTFTVPTQNSTIIATDTTTNRTYSIQIGGNVTIEQFSNMTITPYQVNGTTIVDFNLTGPSGTEGFCNLTLPKTAIPFGTKPVVYIDGVVAENQSCTEDADNYYVAYTTHFSTHHIEILFSTETDPTDYPPRIYTPSASTPLTSTPTNPTSTPAPNPTVPPTINPTTTPTSTPTTSLATMGQYISVLAAAVILCVVIIGLAQRRKRGTKEA